MKTFEVYFHPTLGYQAVKIGFSWPGLVLGFLWLLFKKLWAQAGAWIGVIVVLALVQEIAQNEFKAGVELLMNAIAFGSGVACGFYGNAWRGTNLLSRGFTQLETVLAGTPDAAIAAVAPNHNRTAPTTPSTIPQVGGRIEPSA